MGLAAFALAGLWCATADAACSSSYDCSYSFTNAEQTYTVPAGVLRVHIQAAGAPGAALQGAGGEGALITADVPLAPGTTTLYVEVGGSGVDGGFNGGGAGGDGFGGGGASDVRTSPRSVPLTTSDTRLVVAAGGGGSGLPGGAGGDAGSAAPGTCGGEAGAIDRGGAAVNCSDGTPGDCAAGSDGQLGQGGAGGNNVGGGGGGGFYGGAGGGGWLKPACLSLVAGGGGGSSFATAQAVNASGISPVVLDSTGTPQVTVTAPIPMTAGVPTLGSQVVVGQTLTESHAIWSGSQSYAYQWERCDLTGAIDTCVAIAGATGQSYMLAPADAGFTVRVQETASNFYGSAVATSDASGAIGEIPALTSPPVIAGASITGQTLTAQNGSWTSAPSSFAHQWLRCNSAGALCAPILTATGQSYTLTMADLRSTIRVQEVASNRYGGGSPAISAPTATVNVPAPTCSNAGATVPVRASSVVVALSCLGPPAVALTYEVISPPAHGTLGAINQRTGAVTYTPRAGFRGRDSFTYEATDMGGSSNLAAATILRPKPIAVINSTMTWTFAFRGAFTTVVSLVVADAPAAGHVAVSCKGSGCGFKSKIVTGRVIPCKVRSCKHKPPKHSTTVSLTNLFRHQRLKSGATVTVRIEENNAIAKTYVFTMRNGQGPSTRIN
jgi:hypothetical protein